MSPSPSKPTDRPRSSRVDFSVFDPSFLARRIREHTGIDDPMEGEAWLAATSRNPERERAFQDFLNIGYTEFFRDPLAFAVLERLILPPLRERRGSEIRVWSAGCATGPEAWSIALLLEDARRAAPHPLEYRVIGTDLSEENLAVARAGAYPIAALENARARHLRDAFAVDGERATVGDALRARVSFSRLDLIDPRAQSPAESIYGGFDIVLCCNVLLYYRPDVRTLILGKLRRALSPGGCLVTGEAERGIVEKAGGFRAVAPPATVFEKEK